MSICPLTKQACTDKCAWHRDKDKCAAITALSSIALHQREVADRLAVVNTELHKLADVMPEKEEPKRPKEVREITDQELENYITKLNPLEIANKSTYDVYAEFSEWAAASGLKPCTQTKFTRRTCAVHPFESVGTKYTPIRRSK